MHLLSFAPLGTHFSNPLTKATLLFFNLALVVLTLMASSSSQAAEVASCSMKDTSVTLSLDSKTALMEYRIVPTNWSDREFAFSPQTCAMMGAAHETISVLNVTIGVVGLACTLAPEPALTKSAAVMMVIGGIGLKYVEYTVQKVVEQCNDAERDAKTKQQVEAAIKSYMKQQGYRVQ